MTCAPYVVASGAVLGHDLPIAEAIRLVAANAFSPLPVVDDSRRLVGLFGPRELAGLLLPVGARLAGDSFALGFVSETPADLRERLASAAADPVGKHAAAHTPIRAETSLDEALLRMHRGAILLAVVDDDNRLVGVMSAAAMLAPLVEVR